MAHHPGGAKHLNDLWISDEAVQGSNGEPVADPSCVEPLALSRPRIGAKENTVPTGDPVRLRLPRSSDEPPVEPDGRIGLGPELSYVAGHHWSLTFDEPGRYLVTYTVTPHLVEAKRCGFDEVK